MQFPLVRNVKPYPSPGGRTISASSRARWRSTFPSRTSGSTLAERCIATEDEADLQAGRMAAFNKQGQRLIEATHDKDPFARVRAEENLKNWVAEAKKNQEEAGRVGADNKALQSQSAQTRA